MQNELYKHGKIECSICCDADECKLEDGWEIYNNPCYWGSSSPKVLVLGYSKGATQMNSNYDSQDEFNKIAFKGMRPRLKQVLVKLNLIDESVDIDKLFSKDEERFGFASLVRCGVSLDGKTSGSLINKSFKEDTQIKDIIDKCTTKFLKENMPDSVEEVVLLGSLKDYKKKLTKHFEIIYADEIFEKIDDSSFKANNIIWRFVAHPSPANGHFDDWMNR